jgi:hypothetical protein
VTEEEVGPLQGLMFSFLTLWRLYLPFWNVFLWVLPDWWWGGGLIGAENLCFEERHVHVRESVY